MSQAVQAGNGRRSLCVLTQRLCDAWQSTGIRPDCTTHQHVPVYVALRWIDYPRENGFLRVQWAGRDAVLAVEKEAPTTWKTVYFGRGELGGPGCPGLQMVPGDIQGRQGSIHYQGGIPSAGARDIGRRGRSVRDNNCR
jgi:hypothetical protein